MSTKSDALSLTSLIKCGFLCEEHVESELAAARNVLQVGLTDQSDSEDIGEEHGSYRHYGLSANIRKAYYVDFMHQAKLRSFIIDSFTADRKQLWFAQYNHLTILFSRSKSTVDKAIAAAYQSGGDLPIWKAKHFIENQAVYTVLIDTRFSFTPFSPN